LANVIFVTAAGFGPRHCRGNNQWEPSMFVAEALALMVAAFVALLYVGTVVAVMIGAFRR
jgi:hypothetical protein